MKKYEWDDGPLGVVSELACDRLYLVALRRVRGKFTAHLPDDSHRPHRLKAKSMEAAKKEAVKLAIKRAKKVAAQVAAAIEELERHVDG